MATYTAGSFTFGEQPSTSKWNDLWDNDQSFHDGNGIQPVNDQYIRWNDSGGSLKDVIKLGSDNFLRLGQIERDNDGTASTMSDIMLQHGWGYIEGDTSVEVTETVTFPTAFNSAPIVYISHPGRTGSAPSAITDFTDVAGSGSLVRCATTSITASNFVARVKSSNANLGSGNFYGYTWLAIGSKA